MGFRRWGGGGPLGGLVKTLRLVDRPGVTVCLGYPDVAKGVGRNHEFRWVARPCDREGQLGATLLGPAFAEAYVCRQCSCNAANALANRHLKEGPACKRVPERCGVLEFAIARTYRWLVGGARRRWRLKWTASKLAAIDKSRAKDPYRPSKVKLTVKREVLHARPTKARGIMAYVNLRTQAEFGWAHACWQKALCAVVGGDDVRGWEVWPGIRIAVASGWSAQRLGDWAGADRVGYGWVYERDGKNWDATMSLPLLEFKRQAMACADPALAASVEAGERVRGTHYGPDIKLRYRACGTVKSGHNDTTSGNSYINAMVCADACRRAGARADILVVGDDLVAFVDRRFALEQLESEYGIQPEARWFRDITQASFISACWVEDGGVYVFTPLPGRLLSRLWWTVSPPGRRHERAYRHGVAVGLLSTYAANPLLRAFLEPALEGGSWSDDMYDERVRKRPGGRVADIDWRGALARRYGVSVGEIDRWCALLRSLGPQPRVCDRGPLERLFEVDLADIGVRQVG